MIPRVKKRFEDAAREKECIEISKTSQHTTDYYLAISLTFFQLDSFLRTRLLRIELVGVNKRCSEYLSSAVLETYTIRQCTVDVN